MKFAFLGADSQTLALAEELLRNDTHELVAFFAASGQQERLEHICGFSQSLHWETLIDDRSVDAIVVFRPDSTSEAEAAVREEQLRKLARGSTPLLIAHPACDALAAYELEMVRRESGVLFLPFAFGWNHPAFTALAELLHAPPAWLGEVEQIIFERRLPDRSQNKVLAHFAQDADLVRRLQGDITKISATGPGTGVEAKSLANVNVVLTGEFPALVRWAVQPADEPSAQLTLWGKHGKAVLHMPAETEPWRLEVDAESSQPQQWPHGSEPRVLLDTFENAVDGKPSATTWLDACRALELTESLPRSLKKGRALMIGNETETEIETRNFKGLMAAGGCLIVLLVLLAMFAGALIDGVMSGFRAQTSYNTENGNTESGAATEGESADENPPRTPGRSLWRLWPVIPLVIFLLLQLLRFVIREPDENTTNSPSPARPPPK